MKKLVSLLLVAMMLITAVSAFADEAADKAKHPALGGFDWNPYDSDGDKGNGISEKGIPGWLAARIMRAVEIGFVRYPFNPYYDCCIFCVIADCDCYECAGVHMGIASLSDYFGEDCEHSLPLFGYRYCGVPGCYCMDPETFEEFLDEYYNGYMPFIETYFFNDPDCPDDEEEAEALWEQFLADYDL